MGQFQRHVFVCTHGEYCPFQGSGEVHRLLKEGVQARGLRKVVRINKSGCLDQCGHGPMVVVYPDDAWYADVDLDKARRILEEHLVGGRAASDLLYAAPPGAHKHPAKMAAIEKRKSAAAPGGPGTSS